jgi:hypothetical protein
MTPELLMPYATLLEPPRVPRLTFPVPLKSVGKLSLLLFENDIPTISPELLMAKLWEIMLSLAVASTIPRSALPVPVPLKSVARYLFPALLAYPTICPAELIAVATDWAPPKGAKENIANAVGTEENSVGIRPVESVADDGAGLIDSVCKARDRGCARTGEVDVTITGSTKLSGVEDETYVEVGIPHDGSVVINGGGVAGIAAESTEVYVTGAGTAEESCEGLVGGVGRSARNLSEVVDRSGTAVVSTERAEVSDGVVLRRELGSSKEQNEDQEAEARFHWHRLFAPQKPQAGKICHDSPMDGSWETVMLTWAQVDKPFNGRQILE